MKRRILPIVSTVLVLFGAVTLFMSTAVILDLIVTQKRWAVPLQVAGLAGLVLTSLLTLLGCRALPATRHHSPPGPHSSSLNKFHTPVIDMKSRVTA